MLWGKNQKENKQAKSGSNSAATPDKNPDFLGISEEVSFSTQQLIWAMDKYRKTMASLGELAKETSKSSESNAANIEEITAELHEVAEVSANISEFAEEGNKMCRESSEAAKEHQQNFLRVSRDVAEITEDFQHTVEKVSELNDASDKIANFVANIEGIAKQTNLLALNASIEAARAGESGRGFSVVAQQVGSLANETAVTTEEVRNIVTEITEITRIVTERMIESGEALKKATEEVLTFSENMGQIVDSIQNVENSVRELTEKAEAQKKTMSEMSDIVENIGNATIKISENTQETSRSIDSEESDFDTINSYAHSILDQADIIQDAAVIFKKSDEIVFGVNPFTVPEKIKTSYAPILEAAAKKAGYSKARTIIVKDYEALGSSLASGKIDVGWFSPFAYCSAKEKAPGIIPLVTPRVNGNTSYTGYIISRKGSGIKSLDDLKGKKFGFVDEKSASGYVYPRAALLEQGKNPSTYFGKTLFLGSHNKVIDAVLSGEIDAGATYSEAFDDSARKDSLDIIFNTEPIPKDAIAAAPGMDEKKAEILKESFASLKTEDASGAMNEAHISGFVTTEDSTYDVVRKAAKA